MSVPVVRPGPSHPIGVGLVAVIGLFASWAIAVQDPVPAWELRLTERVNDAPATVATMLDPVMQLGTLAGPLLAAAAIVWLRRDPVLAVATVVAGVATWFAAKGIKQVVGRDRPATYLPDIVVGEGDGAGLGYLSGHSAVAACAALCAMAAMSPRWRPLAALIAGLVGVARVVHGVHLPADVVGGWSFGALTALVAVAIVERASPLVASPDRFTGRRPVR